MDNASRYMTEQLETLRDDIASKLGIGVAAVNVAWARDTIPGVSRVSITLAISDARELAR